MNRIYLSGIVLEEPICIDSPEGKIHTFLLANENGTYRVNAAKDDISIGDEIKITGSLSQRSLHLKGAEVTCTEIEAEELVHCAEDEGSLYPALASVFEATICQKLLAVLFLALLIRFTGDD